MESGSYRLIGVETQRWREPRVPAPKVEIVRRLQLKRKPRVVDSPRVVSSWKRTTGRVISGGRCRNIGQKALNTADLSVKLTLEAVAREYSRRAGGLTAGRAPNPAGGAALQTGRTLIRVSGFYRPQMKVKSRECIIAAGRSAQPRWNAVQI
jgi:hypothetical protein